MIGLLRYRDKDTPKHGDGCHGNGNDGKTVSVCNKQKISWWQQAKMNSLSQSCSFFVL